MGKSTRVDVATLLKNAAGGKAKTAIITCHTLCLGNRGGAEASEVDALDPAGFCRPLEGSFESITQAGKEAGIKLISLYPSMVYGKEGWFKNLVNNIVYGKAKLVEPGDNYLSLLHIDDLAGLYAEIAERIDEDAMYTLSDLDAGHAEGDGSPYCRAAGRAGAPDGRFRNLCQEVRQA